MAKAKIPWDVIAAAVVSGSITMREAAEKFGIPVGTIMARSARADWFGKKAKAARETRLATPEEARDIVEVINESAEFHAVELSPGTEQPGAPAGRTINDAGAEAPGHPGPGTLVVQDPRPVVTGKEVVKAVVDQIEEAHGEFRNSMARTLKRTAKSLETMHPDTVFAKADKLAALAKAGQSVFGEEEKKGATLVVSFSFLNGEIEHDHLPVIDAVAEPV